MFSVMAELIIGCFPYCCLIIFLLCNGLKVEEYKAYWLKNFLIMANPKAVLCH